MNPVPGVPNSEIFIGGGEERVGGDPCSARMYRPALVIRGYLPGVYQYTVDNADTPGDVTSPTFSISGMFINSSVSQLVLFHFTSQQIFLDRTFILLFLATFCCFATYIYLPHTSK